MQAINRYYNNKALSYGVNKIRLEKVLDILGDVRGQKILDIGCATGYIGREFKKRGATVMGVDISRKAVKLAKEILDDALVSDLNEEKLPYPKEYFDIVTASEIIEHLFRPLSFLKESRRVLKKGGRAVITTPNFLYLGNRLNFLLGRFQYTKEGMFDESHLHFYTYNTLKDDLEKSNFKIIKENHIYMGTRTLTKIKKYFPGVFAYQFIVKCIKL